VEMSYKQCVACGGVAVWNPRDEWWSCRDCPFQWSEGWWGITTMTFKDELGNWEQVPFLTLPVLWEREE